MKTVEAKAAARDLRFEARMKALEAKAVARDLRFEARMKALEAKAAARDLRFEARMKTVEAKAAARDLRFEARMKALEAKAAESDERLEAEMKAIKAEIAKNDARFETVMKAHREEMAELDAKIKKHQESAARHQEAVTRYREQERQQEAVHRKEWEALEEMVGGIDETQGQVAEDFFYQALLETPCIGDIPFKRLRPNVIVSHRGRQAEYDLIMDNGKFVAIVEIRQRLRKTDVEKVHSVLMPNARRMLQELRGKTLVPVVAGMITDEDAVALAHDYGYVVLTPNGQQVRADVTHLRCIPCNS